MKKIIRSLVKSTSKGYLIIFVCKIYFIKTKFPLNYMEQAQITNLPDVSFKGV